LVENASEALRRFAQADFRRSSLWLTNPVDCPPQSPDFVNAVVAFRPARPYTPERLLSELKAMERRAGRLPRSCRNAPRLLDLDLLVYGQQRRQGSRLKLPHPRAASRRFVLAPAAEIVPQLRWPGTQYSVVQLLDALRDDDQAVALPSLARE
jgi:2-amino-4-hydroxy-6-hydroxymethyldihydropteridine diphosphokinase